jgi:hypothetical protein
VKSFAEEMIDGIRIAAQALAIATTDEMQMEFDKAAEKSKAIQRLMNVQNPETNKVHSASSAEKVVELDPEYYAWLQRKSQATVKTIEAKAQYECAKLIAQLAVNNATRSQDPVLAGVGS